MPALFDPNLPANHSPMSSAEMRGQLNALHDLITANLHSSKGSSSPTRRSWLRPKPAVITTRK
jgi:hypothetical protein